jgi:hypothetical protein
LVVYPVASRAVTWARKAPVGESDHGVQPDTQGADQGHDPRVAEPQGRGPPAIGGHRWQRDPLKGWARKDKTLADAFSIHQTAVACTGLILQFVQVLQAGEVPQVPWGVDHGLNAQRPSFLEILLDPGVLVEHVHGRVYAAGHNPGGEAGLGVRADPPVEDQRYLIGATNPQVVLDQGFEERPSASWGVKDQGAGDLAAKKAMWTGSTNRPVMPPSVGHAHGSEFERWMDRSSGLAHEFFRNLK